MLRTQVTDPLIGSLAMSHAAVTTWFLAPVAEVRLIFVDQVTAVATFHPVVIFFVVLSATHPGELIQVDIG